MGKRKVAVSQRWDEETLNLVKSGSEKLDISQTQFTVEAIHVYFELLKNEELMNLSLEQRINKIKSALANSDPPPTKINSVNPSKNRRRPPGYIYDHVYNFLKSHPNEIFSTIEIAFALNVPQPTVRTYVRKLSKNKQNKLKLYPGRPNKVQYIPD